VLVNKIDHKAIGFRGQDRLHRAFHWIETP